MKGVFRMDDEKPTVILNKNTSDGFIDFSNSQDLDYLIKMFKEKSSESN